jgi:putative component of membrane protein insertase Oxa1/YidC/SpoIIIJ protein YidD
MIEAIREKGAWLGLRMGAKRLLRCHPWGGFGFDPVQK